MLMIAFRPYLEFIRYSLNPKDEMVKDGAVMDWEEMFRFADEQGILGLMYEGRRRMEEGGPKKENGFLDGLTLEWGFWTQEIERKNQEVNVAAVKLLKSLRKRGFDGCILKGQGNSLLYPKPYSRSPGDIDVWVKSDGRGKKEDGRGKVDDVRRVIRFVKERIPEARATYHHIDGGEIDGIEVEFHYRPSFMNNLILNRRLQKWFAQKAPEQFCHEVELPVTDYTDEHIPIDGHRICVPTWEFNVVFLLSHIFRHLLQEGIGLKQVIDYYYLLRATDCTDYNGTQRLRDAEALLRRLGLWKIAGAVMWVLSDVLGLEEKYLIAPKDERLGKVLLSEILNGGNFGQYDRDGRWKKEEGRVKKNWQRLKRDVRMMRYFPSECLWEPVFRLYHFFWRARYESSFN